MDVDTAGRIGDALPAMLSGRVQTWGTDVSDYLRELLATENLLGQPGFRPLTVLSEDVQNVEPGLRNASGFQN